MAEAYPGDDRAEDSSFADRERISSAGTCERIDTRLALQGLWVPLQFMNSLRTIDGSIVINDIETMQPTALPERFTVQARNDPLGTSDAGARTITEFQRSELTGLTPEAVVGRVCGGLQSIGLPPGHSPIYLVTNAGAFGAEQALTRDEAYVSIGLRTAMRSIERPRMVGGSVYVLPHLNIAYTAARKHEPEMVVSYRRDNGDVEPLVSFNLHRLTLIDPYAMDYESGHISAIRRVIDRWVEVGGMKFSTGELDTLARELTLRNAEAIWRMAVVALEHDIAGSMAAAGGLTSYIALKQNQLGALLSFTTKQRTEWMLYCHSRHEAAIEAGVQPDSIYAAAWSFYEERDKDRERRGY